MERFIFTAPWCGYSVEFDGMKKRGGVNLFPILYA